MPAIPKPHRIAVLVPDVALPGVDAAYTHEAAALIWTACIEACQRHARLAVLDADATPLAPQDGHFAPRNASRGGRPGDAFYAPTRRDELIWLEVALGEQGAPRTTLHAIARDGAEETFAASGIQPALDAWAQKRGLGAFARPLEPASAEEIVAVVRVIAPTLVEQARAWARPATAARRGEHEHERARERDRERDDTGDLGDFAGDTSSLPALARDELIAESSRATTGNSASSSDARVRAIAPTTPTPLVAVGAITMATRGASTRDGALASSAADGRRGPLDRRRAQLRPLVNRLPAIWRAHALRLLELALGEPLTAELLAIDPDHPQARFARFEIDRDPAALRAILAAAPGWARPYEELDPSAPQPGGAAREGSLARERDGSATSLEAVAAAGMAAVCRPASTRALEAAARRLADAGRVDEALRLLERAAAVHAREPHAHVALLALHARADRPGAWLAAAERAARVHGCPIDPDLPWYDDQILVDLGASSALAGVGRLAEAIALRASRLDGRAAAWPSHARVLESWRADPLHAARACAREAAARGDDGGVALGFRRARPDGAGDLARWLDALVALGREDDAPLAWAQLGIGAGLGAGPASAVARLAACRALAAAGDHRRALEELWRVELAMPGRDEQTAIARAALAMAGAPIDIAEAALGERLALGAATLARRMARSIADFAPAAAKSAIVARALGKPAAIAFEPAWLGGFAPDVRGRRAIDALFDELGALRAGPPQGFEIADELARGDRLVNRWLDVAIAAGGDDRAALAQAAAYTAAQALARYLAATTCAPTTLAGALRVVAAEALALVRANRDALGDRDARALLGALDPLLRRVDRWLGGAWLATAERSVGVDERAAGDVAGFVTEYPTVASRILGPEETAVLAWSAARLHRERPDGWAGKVAAQASRLVAHSGAAGADEWADAVAAQLAAREVELDDAIDALLTASYHGDGATSGPVVHAARVLFEASRAPMAIAVLLRASGPVDPLPLRDAWSRAQVDVPFDPGRAAIAASSALSAGDSARAERLARWAIAAAPRDATALQIAGTALAQQGKIADALAHLARAAAASARNGAAGTSAARAAACDEDVLERLAAIVAERGLTAEAAIVLRYANGAPPPGRDPIYAQLESGDHAAAAAKIREPRWRVRRAALSALRFRTLAENDIAVTPRARAGALAVLADSAGSLDRDALAARCAALAIREQAYFARDPSPRLGERPSRASLGAANGSGAPAAPEPFVDRVVIAGGKVSRASDYIALLRDLAALTPREALAQFDLDEAGYLEIARTWAAALDGDPALAAAIAAGLRA